MIGFWLFFLLSFFISHLSSLFLISFFFFITCILYSPYVQSFAASLSVALNFRSWRHIYCFNVVIVDIIVPSYFASSNIFLHQYYPRMLHHGWGKKMVLVNSRVSLVIKYFSLGVVKAFGVIACFKSLFLQIDMVFCFSNKMNQFISGWSKVINLKISKSSKRFWKFIWTCHFQFWFLLRNEWFFIMFYINMVISWYYWSIGLE